MTCLLLVTAVAVDVITAHIKGSAVVDFRDEILHSQRREAGREDRGALQKNLLVISGPFSLK